MLKYKNEFDLLKIERYRKDNDTGSKIVLLWGLFFFVYNLYMKTLDYSSINTFIMFFIYFEVTKRYWDLKYNLVFFAGRTSDVSSENKEESNKAA